MLNISVESPEIDLDAIAEEVGRLRDGIGETVVESDEVLERIQALQPVNLPSWGGRIEPKRTRRELDEDNRYQCGR